MGKKFLGLGGTDHFWDRAKAWILNQITSAVAAKIAEVVANAPEDLDTLKEIADWIKAHANDAAAMNTQITENKNNIASLSDGASAMNTQIQTNKNNIAAMNTQITENKNNIASLSDGASAMNTQIQTNKNNIAALQTSVAGKADKAHTHSTGDITSGTLPIANGGTGATTAKGAQKSLLSDMQTETTAMDDTTEFVMKYGTPTDTKGALFKRSAPLVWNYISGKISSVLGLTKDNYGGKSAKSSFLDEYIGAGGTRITTLNIVPKDASEYGGMRKDIVTESVTDDSYPGVDGHLLTMFWDNGSRYDGQLFISNRDPITVKVRYTANKAGYQPWVDLITSESIGSQTVANANIGMVHTCFTSMLTNEKTVSIPGFTLTQGACIRVEFADGNSAENPKLKVNSNDAMPIYINKHGNLSFIAKDWDAGISMTLMFNGDSFVVLGNPIVKLKLNLATANTGAKRNFIRYASGLLIQWGTVIVNGLTPQPIEAYTEASSYSVLATPSDGATGWIKCLRKDKETIQLAIETVSGGYTDGTVSWLTIGW